MMSKSDYTAKLDKALAKHHQQLERAKAASAVEVADLRQQLEQSLKRTEQIKAAKAHCELQCKSELSNLRHLLSEARKLAADAKSKLAKVTAEAETQAARLQSRIDAIADATHKEQIQAQADFDKALAAMQERHETELTEALGAAEARRAAEQKTAADLYQAEKIALIADAAKAVQRANQAEALAADLQAQVEHMQAALEPKAGDEVDQLGQLIEDFQAAQVELFSLRASNAELTKQLAQVSKHNHGRKLELLQSELDQARARIDHLKEQLLMTKQGDSVYNSLQTLSKQGFTDGSS